MTLVVGASWIDEAGDEHALPLQSNLAGFESARTTFYGCAAARALGLRLFPLLGDGYALEARDGELDDLLLELDLLARHAQAIGQYESFWRFRLDNIRRAIDAAKAHGRAGLVRIG